MKEFDQSAIEDICAYAFSNYGVEVTELTMTTKQLSDYNKKEYSKVRILLADDVKPSISNPAPSGSCVHLKTK